MNKLDPYAPIEKSPLYAPDSMQSNGYSIRIEDESSDTGWKEVGLVSEGYLLVPNTEVRNMAHEIAFYSPYEWEEEKVHFDGKRFTYALSAKTHLEKEVREGDVVSLGMLFQNSYDGSIKLSASLFAYRLVCMNGMILPQIFSKLCFRHDRSSAGWGDEIRRTLTMIKGGRDGLEHVTQAASRLAETPMDSEKLAQFRRGPLSDLPITLWGKMMDQYLHEEEHTAWGLLNAGTHVTWHRNRSLRDYAYNQSITAGLLQEHLPAA